jgi:hypothetical protein
MGHSELQVRIQQFLNEYWNSSEGREHYQDQKNEQQEVQEVYTLLQEKRAKGIDITDETLLRLLPHNDTLNNRVRGARISSWPCITKDVVAWFEGANWKTHEQWPQTANWLLDIVEAGYLEQWDRWNQLVKHWAKKGFEAGFITPIIHCLNPDLPVINSKVVKTYKQIAQHLGLSTELTAKLEDYPKKSYPLLIELIDNLKPAGIENINQWDIYCHWNVAKHLGGNITFSEPQLISNSPNKLNLVSKSFQLSSNSAIANISKELLEAQYDSENYDRFEIAIAEAFEVLGFQVDHIGGSGQADIVASLALGEESFSVVIDAKSKREGAYSANSGYSQIKNHQEENTSDFALIIAPSFAGGNTVKFAQEQKICLMTTQQLISLLEAHGKSPLSLYYIKSIFDGNAGLIKVSLETESYTRNEGIEIALHVLQAFETYQREGGGDIPYLNAEQILVSLRTNGLRFRKSSIEDVIQLLANPLVDILKPYDQGYILTVPAKFAGARLVAIAQNLSRKEEQ